jgi:predicted nucleic acid-binding Zn ribbon protein
VPRIFKDSVGSIWTVEVELTPPSQIPALPPARLKFTDGTRTYYSHQQPPNTQVEMLDDNYLAEQLTDARLERVRCNHCGTENREDRYVCSQCDRPLRISKVKHYSKKLLFILGSIVVIVVIIWLAMPDAGNP